MNVNGGPDHMRGGGDQSVALVALVCALIALVLTFGPMWAASAQVKSEQRYVQDCESRGGHATFDGYPTCYDASGKPEGVPYR